MFFSEQTPAKPLPFLKCQPPRRRAEYGFPVILADIFPGAPFRNRGGNFDARVVMDKIMSGWIIIFLVTLAMKYHKIHQNAILYVLEWRHWVLTTIWSDIYMSYHHVPRVSANTKSIWIISVGGLPIQPLLLWVRVNKAVIIHLEDSNRSLSKLPFCSLPLILIDTYPSEGPEPRNSWKPRRSPRNSLRNQITCVGWSCIPWVWLI